MLTCPRCQRTNPAEAAYCHFDGIDLRAGRDGVDYSRLPHEFVFAAGRRCRSYDELAQGCLAEWEAARELLRQGTLEQFLSGCGRLDLARAAQEARAQPDDDAALSTFLTSLPTTAPLPGPRLDLKPRRLNLGSLQVGETRQVQLLVSNQGQGVLSGTLTVAEGCGWLKLGESGGRECALKIVDEQLILLEVDTRGLTAPQPFSTHLTLITNGGIVELPVRLELTAIPFPREPLQGAGSPRALAERIRQQPKAAAPLLETGEVARWFAANGWNYPVQGPTAPGLAAVQQFFEALGLARAPVVHLAEAEVRLDCPGLDPIRGQLTVLTRARKWVHARAESDVPWLRLLTPNAGGPRQAVLPFEVDPANLTAGVHETTLRIFANANQRLTLPVRVEVTRPEKPRRRLVQSVLAGMLAGFLLRLLLALPADVYARVLATPAEAGAGSFAAWLQVPGDVAYVQRVVLATWWVGALAGVALLWRRGRWTDLPCGFLAGAGAGLLAGATVACALPILESWPRETWRHVVAFAQSRGWADSAALGTAAWVAWVSLWWLALGGLAGLALGCVGRPGQHLLTQAAEPVACVFRLCGLRKAATLFRLE